MYLRIISPALLVCVALAGCTSEDASDTPDDGPDPDGTRLDSEGRVKANQPEWLPGMSWTYRTDNGESYTAVVTETAEHLMVLAASPEPAFQEAYEDVLLLGQFSADDLSGTFQGEPFDLFDWPLVDGVEYDAEFMGLSLRANASFDGDGRWEIEFFDGNNLVLTAEYDEQLQWFERITKTVDGQVVTVAERTAFDQRRSGPAFSYELKMLAEYDFQTLQSSFGQSTVDAQATDLLYVVGYECSAPAAGTLEMHPRDDPAAGISETLQCPGSKPETHEVLPITGGPWIRTIAMTTAPESGELSFHAEFIERTLIEHSIQA